MFREGTGFAWQSANHQRAFIAYSWAAHWLPDLLWGPALQVQAADHRFVLQIFSGVFCVASPGPGPLPLPLPSPVIAWPASPLAPCQHLALHNLAEHFEAPLQLSGAHVAGEIANVHHTAFALLEKGNTGGPIHFLASWDPLDGGEGVLCSPSLQPTIPAEWVTPTGAGIREGAMTTPIPKACLVGGGGC